jgi:hypothetical protein
MQLGVSIVRPGADTVVYGNCMIQHRYVSGCIQHRYAIIRVLFGRPRGTKSTEHGFEALARVGRISKWRHPNVLEQFFVLPRSLSHTIFTALSCSLLTTTTCAAAFVDASHPCRFLSSGGWHVGVPTPTSSFKASTEFSPTALDHDVVGV